MSLMISFPWHKADGAGPKLTRILKDYDQREEQADPPVAHSAWLKTAQGKEDAAYLAGNYDHLHEMRKYDVPTELARTGDIHVIPLLKKAIADPTYGKSVLSGLFFACHLGNASDEFRKTMAPEVIRWIGKGSSPGSDLAVVYFQADSENGGISQALGNSTGDRLPLVRKGYGEIGAVAALDYLNWMCKPFGPEGPSADGGQRNRQMEAMKPSYFDQQEQLSDAWVKLNAEKQIPSAIWLVNRYAARHASELRPLLNKTRK